MSHHLDKGEESYYPSECGDMESEMKNVGPTRFHVSSVAIQFDWMKNDDKLWYRKCSVELSPNETKPLPPCGFRIPTDVEVGSHTYQIGCTIEVLVNSNWVSMGKNMGKMNHHILISKHPERNFKVFVSHSNAPQDKPLVNKVENILGCCGVDVYIAEKRAEPGTRLWSKIEREIKTSDSILVLWTEHGAKSGDVREEIGIAVGMGKYEQLVPIAEVDLEGSLKGKEYSTLDRNNPKGAIQEAIETILKMAEKKTVTPTPTRTS